MIRVTIENADEVANNIFVFSQKAKDKVKQAVRTSTYKITRNAKQKLTRNGSVDTGRLLNSVNSKTKDYTGVSGTNVEYAKGVEEGTRAHIIKPKNKKALYWQGAAHPVKVVHHPGSSGKPYLKPSYEEEIPNFMINLRNALRPE